MTDAASDGSAGAGLADTEGGPSSPSGARPALPAWGTSAKVRPDDSPATRPTLHAWATGTKVEPQGGPSPSRARPALARWVSSSALSLDSIESPRSSALFAPGMSRNASAVDVVEEAMEEMRQLTEGFGGIPERVMTTSVFVRLCTPRRHWPRGGFRSVPGWLWKRSVPEPETPAEIGALASALLVAWGLPVISFAWPEFCGKDDLDDVLCNAKLPGTLGLAAYVSTFVTYLALGNIFVGGLRHDVFWRSALVFGVGFLCQVAITAVWVLPWLGYFAFFILPLSAVQVSWMSVVLLLLFDRNVLGNAADIKQFTVLSTTYNTLSVAIIALAVGFLYLQPLCETDLQRLGLNMAFGAVIWLVKRAAYWQEQIALSAMGVACAELWVDSFMSLILLSSTAFMGTGVFCFLLATNLFTTVQVLAWPLWGPARLQHWHGTHGYRLTRAGVIVCVNCVGQITSALGLLGLAHLYRPRQYFSISHLTDEQLAQLDFFLLLWAAGFLALASAVVYAGRRWLGTDPWTDSLVWCIEYTELLSGCSMGSFLIFTLLGIEHFQVMWYIFPHDGLSY